MFTGLNLITNNFTQYFDVVWHRRLVVREQISILEV